MSQTQTATNKITFGDRLIRLVQGYRRLSRLLFVSPAEVRFVRVMGGRALNIPFIKSKRTGFCLTFMWLGKVLKRELIEREVRIGRYFADFSTPNAAYKKIIEIDGNQFHTYKMDVVADQERDDYLKARGWQVLHIPAHRLSRDPRKVYMDVKKFLSS